MNRLLISALLIACFASVSTAQEQTQFTMPCAQVLRLGVDKFVSVYGEKTQDFSTHGQKQAFNYYVDCKRAANDKRATPLSPEASKQVDEIITALQDISNAAWSN